jgi:hypothetical protein
MQSVSDTVEACIERQLQETRFGVRKEDEDGNNNKKPYNDINKLG